MPRNSGFALIIMAMGLIIFAIGAMAVIGHALQIEGFYRWGEHDIGMALATALGFCNIGAAIVLIGFVLDDRRTR